MRFFYPATRHACPSKNPAPASATMHAARTTPVLDVGGLGRGVRVQAARARDAASRPAGETDAVLLGKLAMLDALAARLWSEELSGTETAELQAAANELGRAVEFLTERSAAVTLAAADANAHAKKQGPG